ncbi:hypothetical protein B4N89_47200 [Embleya scabrispora]|uniref:Uncharacterized protein n=1 Tax=Embleya scabrispora TaxID=159449 RepID=A0A1T3NHX8_9ACTN|nr:hypothetical protein B4N89_47200 [Embleya scabrispora]
MRTGGIATNATAGVAVPVLAAIMAGAGLAGVSGPLTTRRWVLLLALAGIGLLLALVPVHLAHTRARRRLEIGPHALVLHDAHTTVPLPWRAIAEITLTLRPGRRPDAGTVRLDVRLRDGTLRRRAMYHIEEDMFRPPALDPFPGVVVAGARYTVDAARVIRDEIAAPTANTRPAVPPRPSTPPP